LKEEIRVAAVAEAAKEAALLVQIKANKALQLATANAAKLAAETKAEAERVAILAAETAKKAADDAAIVTAIAEADAATAKEVAAFKERVVFDQTIASAGTDAAATAAITKAVTDA
jgi:hypothetical protein